MEAREGCREQAQQKGAGVMSAHVGKPLDLKEPVVVHKVQLDDSLAAQVRNMPENFEPLRLDRQDGELTLWYRANVSDTTAEMTVRMVFYSIGTGYYFFVSDAGEYIGTYFYGPLVLHLHAKPESEIQS
jgi:hypothetical protein